MREKALVGIGRVVLNTRERICAVEPRDHRMLLTTRRTHEDIVAAMDGGGITDLPKPNRRMLDVAATIIEQHAGAFDPSSFNDRYEDAVRDLLAQLRRSQVARGPSPFARPGPGADTTEERSGVRSRRRVSSAGTRRGAGSSSTSSRRSGSS